MIQRLQQNNERSRLDLRKPDDPVVLCAADQNYVRPLTVMLHSAATSLQEGNHLHVILLDGGITQEGWKGLQDSLDGLPVSISTIVPNVKEVADLGVSHHITHTAYLRLLAGRLLPESIDKVIYLDSDVLIKHDLTELWKTEVGNCYCAAAVDIACPFVDAREAGGRFRKSLPYLAALAPIRNWRELGLQGNDHYFNSGVMVINVERWRRENIEKCLLNCLRSNNKYVWCWDQYALNVVFAGQWIELPGRWNQGVHVFEYPDESYSPIEPEHFCEMRDSPSIVHFTTEFKPWLYHPYHPNRNDFFDRLDETAWAGWRPAKPSFSLKRWWDRQALRIIKSTCIGYRKLRY